MTDQEVYNRTSTNIKKWIRHAFQDAVHVLDSAGTAQFSVETIPSNKKGILDAVVLLGLQKEGVIDEGWPIVGECRFSGVHHSKTNKWYCEGVAFGHPFVGDDFRIALLNVVNNMKSTRAVLSDMLERSATYLERYGSDIEMFAHRLQVDLAGSATVVMNANRSVCTIIPINSDRIQLSFTTAGPGRKLVEKFLFGDKRNSREMQVAADTLTKIKLSINSYSEEAEKFLAKLITLIPDVYNRPTDKVMPVDGTPRLVPPSLLVK